jgi:hypothetical protein
MWDIEEPASNETLTDDMIASAERQLGVLLPKSYLDALRAKNGGSTIGQYIKLPTQHVPDHLSRYVDHGYIAVRELNGIGSGDDTILETDYYVGEWGLPNPIVILSGEGHWWIAFDYRVAHENPPIVFLDSDSGDTLYLSNDFASFLSSIVPYKQVFDSYENFIG